MSTRKTGLFRSLGIIMPLYDYDCHACQSVFEFQQSFTDEKLTICPLCGAKDNIERLISIPAFIFVQGEPCNVEHQADRNTRKLSKDFLSEKAGKKQEAKERFWKETEQRSGGKVIKPSKKLPWWRDGSVPGTQRSEKPIDTSKISNIRKYIETGEK